VRMDLETMDGMSMMAVLSVEPCGPVG
jgi:hypothetical protein